MIEDARSGPRCAFRSSRTTPSPMRRQLPSLTPTPQQSGILFYTLPPTHRCRNVSKKQRRSRYIHFFPETPVGIVFLSSCCTGDQSGASHFRGLVRHSDHRIVRVEKFLLILLLVRRALTDFQAHSLRVHFHGRLHSGHGWGRGSLGAH